MRSLSLPEPGVTPISSNERDLVAQETALSMPRAPKGQDGKACSDASVEANLRERLNLKALLLAEVPRTENLTPPRPGRLGPNLR
jgi:hypothetical protein